MVQNAALLALLTVFLIVGWFAGEVRFLAPYKAGLFRLHGALIVGAMVLLFFNLFGAYYAFARWFFLRDTGRKLSHLDQQLTTSDTALQGFDAHMDGERTDVA